MHLLLPLLLGSAGATTPLFDATTAVALPGPPGALTAGDADGDGDLDLVIAASFYGDLRWYANHGDGTFDAVAHVIAPNVFATVVLPLDADGDGDLDVVWGEDLAWAENLGAGVFAPPVGLGIAATDVSTLRAADLDGDGLLDLWVGGTNAGGLSVYRRDPLAGGYDPAPIPITAPDASVTGFDVADLDADGDPDVAWADNSDHTLYQAFDLGGSFSAASAVYAQTGVGAVTLADVSGDGAPDLLAAWRRLSISWGTYLFVAIPGGFGAPVDVTPGDLLDPRAVDLDGDGDLDLAGVGTLTTGAIAVMENLGAGAFAPQGYLAGSVTTAGDLAIGDFDGDGDPDLATTDDALIHDSIVLFRNGGVDSDSDGLSDAVELDLGTDPLLADTDADGLDDAAEVALGSDPTAADADGDGLPDPDELQYGSAWDQADTDGDGLTDGEEVVRTNTSPILADSDADGQDDAGDPCNRGPDADRDADGTIDACLCLASSTDTDADGTPDACEPVRYRSHALGPVGIDAPLDAVTAGDLDGDGDTDLAIASGLGSVWWYPGPLASASPPVPISDDPAVSLVTLDPDGDGQDDLVAGLESMTTLTFASGAFGYAAVPWKGEWAAVLHQLAFDLEGDGNVDYAFTSERPYEEPDLWWSHSAGGGAWAAPEVILADLHVAALEAGDVDGDGLLDLVVHTAEDVRLLQWTGAAFVASAPLPDADAPRVLRDVTGDGLADLVYWSVGQAHLVVSAGGAGGLAPAVNLAFSSFAPTSLAALDAAGDGHADLVLGDGAHLGGIEADDSGGWTAFAAIATGVPPLSSLDAVDLDGDGDLDLLGLADASPVWFENLGRDADADGLPDAYVPPEPGGDTGSHDTAQVADDTGAPAPDTDAPDDPSDPPADAKTGCGCATGPTSAGWPVLLALAALRRTRKPRVARRAPPRAPCGGQVVPPR